MTGDGHLYHISIIPRYGCSVQEPAAMADGGHGVQTKAAQAADSEGRDNSPNGCMGAIASA